MQQAAANMAAMWDSDLADQSVAADEGLQYPDGAGDVLAYLGSLEPLALTAKERMRARAMTQDIVDRYGPEHVWRARTMLRIQLAWVLGRK
jgi:hypothetical protein